MSGRTPATRFDVRLHGSSIAELCVEPSGQCALRFRDTYVNAPRRPVLSLSFLDRDLSVPFEPANGLPTFFLNLLPANSSPLRTLIATSAGISRHDDLAYLAHVGLGLPGAVTVVRPDDALLPPNVVTRRAQSLRMRHSLPGQQLKVSVARSPDWHCPIHGLGGDWLLKIPPADRQEAVVLEAIGLETARALGFEVPEIALLRTDAVERLHEIFDFVPRRALGIRRFDRPTDAPPVHVEDFAQIFDTHPDNLYGEYSPFDLVQLLRVIRGVCGDDDAVTFIGRLVLDAFLGNGDGHLKNWAVTYPDRHSPRLAPVYDVVPIVFWPEFPPEFALPLHGERGFAHFDLERLRRTVAAAGLPLESTVERTVDLVRRLPAAHRMALGALGSEAEAMAERLAAHRAGIPLFREVIIV